MSSYPTPIRDAREAGFLQALETAKDIALDMDIDTLFHTRSKIKRKRHFDENLDDTNVETLSTEEIFRINYFIPIVDQAISSLTRRFEQYQSFQNFFGFLFTSEALQLLYNKSLKSSCDNLEAALKKDGKSDIDANELYMELKFIQDFMPKENMGPIEILEFLKQHDSFPNTSIAYRILLTIQVFQTQGGITFPNTSIDMILFQTQVLHPQNESYDLCINLIIGVFFNTL
jgi:hypothetical protein